MIEICFRQYMYFYCFKSFGYEKNIEMNFVFVYLKRFMKYYFDDFELFIKLIGDLDDSSMIARCL